MGYTLEIWALPVEALVAELRAPTIDPADLDPRPTGRLRVDAERWVVLARTLADAMAAGGGNVVGELADHVVSLVRHLGTPVTSLGHTASGGGWFRDELLGRDLAALLGRGFVAGLVSRELAGLTMLELPMLGWADAAEVQQAWQQAAAGPPEGTDEDVHQLLDAIGTAAVGGTGLVGLYLSPRVG